MSSKNISKLGSRLMGKKLVFIGKITNISFFVLQRFFSFHHSLFFSCLATKCYAYLLDLLPCITLMPEHLAFKYQLVRTMTIYSHNYINHQYISIYLAFCGVFLTNQLQNMVIASYKCIQGRTFIHVCFVSVDLFREHLTTYFIK